MDKAVLVKVSIGDLIDRLKVNPKVKCYVKTDDGSFCAIRSLDIIEAIVKTGEGCTYCFDECEVWVLDSSEYYKIEYQTN
jgi:hypothetical protein